MEIISSVLALSGIKEGFGKITAILAELFHILGMEDQFFKNHAPSHGTIRTCILSNNY